MCNAIDCRHNDPLDDDLSGLFGDDQTPGKPLVVQPRAPIETKDLGDALKSGVTSTRTYEEKCPDCRGTGVWRSYSGYSSGQCFKCKGKGVRRFKTSNEQREKAREAAAAKREQKAANLANEVAAWAEANAADYAWMHRSAPRFEFALSMLEALNKWGSLTEKQHAAVTKCRIGSEAREAQWAAERAERDANKAEVQIDRIAEAFRAAKASKLKWPKLTLGTVTFSLAGENSRNAGSIYVKRGETYLGKIAEGRFTRSRDCNEADEAEIVAVCADPHAAAVAYGKQTGSCSCCGRELTNALSVELGIGPICREKWGWA